MRNDFYSTSVLYRLIFMELDIVTHDLRTLDTAAHVLQWYFYKLEIERSVLHTGYNFLIRPLFYFSNSQYLNI